MSTTLTPAQVKQGLQEALTLARRGGYDLAERAVQAALTPTLPVGNVRAEAERVVRSVSYGTDDLQDEQALESAEQFVSDVVDALDAAGLLGAPTDEDALREQLAGRLEAVRREKVRTSVPPSRQTPRERATSDALVMAQGIVRSHGLENGEPR